MSYKKKSTRMVKSGRKREKWTDILPRYLTFISHMRPILRETRRKIIELDADLLLDIEILDKIRQEEEKRNIRKVRALSEFYTMYRSNVYDIIIVEVEQLHSLQDCHICIYLSRPNLFFDVVTF